MGNCFNFLYIISVTIPAYAFCFLNGNLVIIYLISIGCYFLRKITNLLCFPKEYQ